MSVQGTKESYPCRIRTNLLDKKNGLYIFRYKLYESCDNLQINIMYEDNHVANSPYRFGVVRFDDYNSPTNMKLWLEDWQCNSIPKQITKDLSEFPNINWENLREEVACNQIVYY